MNKIHNPLVTLCSGIGKLFVLSSFWPCDLDESLPGLRYPLSRSSSVSGKALQLLLRM